MNYSLYPRCWKAISKFVRFYRAEGVCEWCEAVNGQPHPATGSKVILTVHHRGVAYGDGRPGDRRDKRDCRLVNLAALCQKCHLDADRDINVRAAQVTRYRPRADQLMYQLRLFE
jgi:hypothetical protein